MSRALALAVGVVLFHRLLAGAEADLGSSAVPLCAALLLASAAFGLLARGERPYLARGVALAVLVPLRGPLADLAQWALPRGALALAVAALLSLVPVGYALGRQLHACVHAAVPTLLVGVCVGEIAVLSGATGWLPAWIAGAAAAALIAALAELRRPGETVEPPPPLAWGERLAALLLGATLGLLAWVLQRVTPGYATPGPGFPEVTAIALLAAAALVALPASLLAGEGWPRRLLGASGGALLAVAATRTLAHLDIHENSVAQVDLTLRAHARAVQLANLLPADAARAARQLPLDAWAWLLMFVGMLAATAGLALGARRGRELGWLLLGAALAAVAPCALIAWPEPAPAALVLAAASAAAASAGLALLGVRGLLLLPLGVLPWLAHDDEGWHGRELPAFEEIRRPGEFGVDAYVRTLPADAVLFLAPGRSATAIVGQQAYATTMTGRAPAFDLDEKGAPRAAFLARPATSSGDAAPAAEPQPERTRGLRVGGVPLHAGHPPLGPEGSTGRLLRLFAHHGAAFVTGVGAELLAADVHDADLSDHLVVSSPVPLGRALLAVLLEDCGSKGWQAAEAQEPLQAARAAEPGSFETVLIAPAPPDAPGVAAQLTEERLARLAALLAPDGRCLAWIDSGGVSRAALAARLAAFGVAFEGRAAAFVEPRELDAPLVLLVGWRTDEGRPTVGELAARLPCPDRTGLRVHLTSPPDLSTLLVRDGAGLLWLAAHGPVHSRGRPVGGAACATGGWDAVAPLFDSGARLSRVAPGATDGPRPSADLLAGLATHARYDYRLEGLDETELEIRPDIDWDAWNAEVACYERAARDGNGGPLLAHALAALLEPLAIVGEDGRFAQVWQRCNAGRLPSWRLALQEWWVQKASLETDAASAAAERAKELFGALK